MSQPPNDFVAAYEAVVARHGARVAIEDASDRRVTHAELWDEAGKLARLLVAAGAGPEAVVALGLPRSVELVTGMLAAWRARAAWTVVEPSLPTARRARCLEVAGARLLVDEVGVRRMTAGVGQGADANTAASAEATLAYVAFTSGSSGSPKGVRIEHRGLLPMLRAQIDAFALDAETRALWVLSPSFDASVSDVGTVLLAGGLLLLDAPDVLADPARLVDVLTRREITAIDLPPSVLARLPLDRLPPTLRTIVIGGEVASVEVVRRASRRHRVVNVYGPTEATVCTSLEVCGPDWPGGTLGQPLPHVRYREVEGELWIGGDALARDYAGEPEQTAARFVVRDGLRWYRTGDRVRREGDAWHFEGRLDRQVKIGGKRVEPEEVEAALQAMGIEGCVVPREVDGRTFLVGFVREPGLTPEQIVARLHARLPAWLVPGLWRVVPELPRTERGKVDRDALARLSLDTRTQWPLDPEARRLAELFAVALGRAVVGEDDDFFALGGDSLALLSFLARAEEAGVPRTASQVHTAPTPKALAGLRHDPERRTTDALLDLVPAPPRRRGPRHGPGSAILLTGATGFLGTRLRRALAARGFEVISLVRASSTEHARARVGAEAFVAELGKENCGMNTSDYEACVERAGLVVHLAARVSVAASYEALAAANVDGTRHALQLASDAGVPFVHASTLSVFVASDRPDEVFFEDDEALVPASIAGGYAQTKWVAEQLVARAEVPTCVLRYGLLTAGRDDLRAPPGDWLVRFVREVAARDTPDGLDTDAIGFDATPVDHAVEATLRLVEGHARGTFHVAGAEPVSARRLLRAVREVGGPTTREGDEAHVLGAARAHDPARFSRQRALDLFAATGVRFDDRRARAFGIEAPRVDDDYLRASVRAMLRGDA